MDIVAVIVGILTVYFMYEQNKILAEGNRITQSQTSRPKPKEAQQVLKVGRVKFGRYWPMAAMSLLAILTWLPQFVQSVPQELRLPSYNKGVTVSISSTSTPGTLEEIVGKTFEDADVPLDGHAFKNCTFVNCCLLYDGGAYALENAKFRKHWRICVKKDDLQNLQSLASALGICKEPAERNIVLPHQNQAFVRQIIRGALVHVDREPMGVEGGADIDFHVGDPGAWYYDRRSVASRSCAPIRDNVSATRGPLPGSLVLTGAKCQRYKHTMRAMGELGLKDLPRAIPAEELQKTLGTTGAFCSWDASNSSVSQAMDRWPFLFSYPLMGKKKKPTS